MGDKVKYIAFIIVGVLLVVNIVIGILAVISGFNHKKGILQVSSVIGNVGVVEILGPIVSDSQFELFSEYVSATSIYNEIKNFANSPNIRAIRIDVTSPGGTVSAAETIVSAIEYAKSKGKKVVVYMKELAASGGYYISAPADVIIASHGTITGSIGVIAANFGFKELFNKVGIEYRVFKSGKNKDMFSPYRDLSPEEKQLIQEIVDVYYNRFIEVILKYRESKLSREELLKIADGRIMSENVALENKLIDKIGDETTVEETLKELTGETVISYVKTPKKRNILKELIGTYFNFSAFGALLDFRHRYPVVWYIYY